MSAAPGAPLRSARLAALLAAVPPCGCLADIACDHAAIAEAAVASGRCGRAIAIDIAAGPLQAAAGRIAPTLRAAIELRRGDGFALAPGEADCAVVAGIGGTLLATLLRRDRPRTLGLRHLVLSPHGDEDEVREALAATGWSVERETLLRAQGRLYLVLRAGWAAEPAARPLSCAEATVGRLARDAEPTLLRAYATVRCATLAREIDGLRSGRSAGERLDRRLAALQAWTELIASLLPAS